MKKDVDEHMHSRNNLIYTPSRTDTIVLDECRNETTDWVRSEVSVRLYNP